MSTTRKLTRRQRRHLIHDLEVPHWIVGPMMSEDDGTDLESTWTVDLTDAERAHPVILDDLRRRYNPSRDELEADDRARRRAIANTPMPAHELFALLDPPDPATEVYLDFGST